MIFQNIVNGALRFKGFPQEAKSLITLLLKKEMTKRLGCGYGGDRHDSNVLWVKAVHLCKSLQGFTLFSLPYPCHYDRSRKNKGPCLFQTDRLGPSCHQGNQSSLVTTSGQVVHALGVDNCTQLTYGPEPTVQQIIQIMTVATLKSRLR